MPPITKDNVEETIKHVVTEREDSLANLTKLTDENLRSGNVADEGLPGQTK